MFRKILIANRGEIACRIIRTARRMGIGTVAVYSDADRDALHVEMAEEAVHIGPPPAAQSYLVIERLVAACRDSGADAVHPGYGFLSERPAFAAALAEAGIAFIGPNARAIEAMGDKIESKRVAAAAGVSTVPGTLDLIEDADAAARVAKEIGFPVMIKASAGGGGKGMRIARSEAEAREGFGLARSEARSSFGDDRVFIEKFIENPRHIEIQVLADKHGNTIYLGERECSVQRRNQKVIEEAPSPLLDARTRARMGEQAIALARAVGYDSAGTVEFVAGQDKSFYFLEMNTRLQVEHPVTELVTGIDLVEQMIRIAAGEKLTIGQRDVRINGWAIESRIYAEDPRREFLPSTGRLVRYRPPAEGSDGETTVRIDSGVVEGAEISLFYDPLIAKLCTHGPTRAAAVEAMSEALDRTVIEGLEHNVAFLAALMAHPRFQAGRLSTAFIAEEFGRGFGGVEPNPATLNRLAAVALSIAVFYRDRQGRMSGRLSPEGEAWQEEWVVRLGEHRVPVRIPTGLAAGPIELDLVFGGEARPVPVASRWIPGEPLWTGTIDGEPMAVLVTAATGGLRLRWRGIDLLARAMSPEVAALDALMPQKVPPDSSRELRCPMPGVVISLAVGEGEDVKAGQPLAIVEAMKMENVLRAERDGTVAKVLVKPGDSLAVDAVMMEFA
jgi:propionyl-CoA carboxylase alpha chain